MQAPRRKIRVTPPAEGYKDGLDAFSPSPFSPPSTSAPSTPLRYAAAILLPESCTPDWFACRTCASHSGNKLALTS